MKSKHISLAAFRRRAVKLEQLDLSKHRTIGQLVDGMSRTAFGGRMLGDVCATLVDWIESGEKPYLICDDPGELRPIFNWVREEGWFQDHYTAAQLHNHPVKRALILGRFSPIHDHSIFNRVEYPIFINNEGWCRPGQIQDGYFPNVVFSDPAFIFCLIYMVLCERLGNQKRPVMTAIDHTAGYGRIGYEVRKAVHIWETMQRDKDCTVFMTLSGAMTVAQQSLLICDMIEKQRVDCIASTGALMAHGLIAGVGLAHFKYNPEFTDMMLAHLGMNRVTDTLEPETNFDHIDHVLNAVLSKLDGTNHSPAYLHRQIGMYLSMNPKYNSSRGILRAAYEQGVPVVVPAFHDSELGNDHMTHNMLRMQMGREQLVMNQELDSRMLLDMFTSAKRLGIISIGGGVPRNHIQNLAPLTEIINARGAAKLPVKKFMYGCRIDPQLPWHGGMGGCTYEENMSWRKFYAKAATAQLRMDATIVWPLIQKALDERMESSE